MTSGSATRPVPDPTTPTPTRDCSPRVSKTAENGRCVPHIVETAAALTLTCKGRSTTPTRTVGVDHDWAVQMDRHTLHTTWTWTWTWYASITGQGRATQFSLAPQQPDLVPHSFSARPKEVFTPSYAKHFALSFWRLAKIGQLPYERICLVADPPLSNGKLLIASSHSR